MAVKKKAAAKKKRVRAGPDSKHKGIGSAAGRKLGQQHPDFKKHKWQPGKSGNPAGRPKGATLEEMLRAHLSEEINDTDSEGKDTGVKTTRLAQYAKTAIERALADPDSKVSLAILDRLYPKPAIDLNLRGPSQITIDEQDREAM